MKRMRAGFVALSLAAAAGGSGCYTEIRPRTPLPAPVPAPAVEPEATTESAPDIEVPADSLPPDDRLPLSDLDGDYSGTSLLERDAWTPPEQGERGWVRFTFDAGKYRCEGEDIASGWGRYELVGDELVLVDRSGRRPGFDGPQVLRGHFTVTRVGDWLLLSQKDAARRLSCGLRLRRVDARR